VKIETIISLISICISVPIISIHLSGCAGVTLTDSEWYGSLGAQGAFGSHTLTNQTETLTLQQWSQKWVDLSHPLVCTSVDTLAEWKGDLEKLCTYSNACSAQVQAQVTAVYNKITAAHATAKKVTSATDK
jgi:hypothetical protein